jgi:hypothetical protein
MISTNLKSDQRIIRGFISAILLVIILVSVYFNPDNYEITSCSFKKITGLSCPGCGLTHSFHATANFRLADGFAFHLMGPIFLFGFILLFLKYLVEIIAGKHLQLSMKNRAVYTVLLTLGITWAGFWICRMVYEFL